MFRTISPAVTAIFFAVSFALSGQAIASASDSKKLYEHCMEAAKNKKVESNKMGEFMKICTGPAVRGIPSKIPSKLKKNGPG